MWRTRENNNVLCVGWYDGNSGSGNVNTNNILHGKVLTKRGKENDK